MLSLNGEAADVDKFAVPGVVLAMAVSLVGVAVVAGITLVIGGVLSDATTLLTGSVFVGTTLTGSVFVGITLTGLVFVGITLTGSIYGGTLTVDVTLVYPVAVPVPLVSFS